MKAQMKQKASREHEQHRADESEIQDKPAEHSENVPGQQFPVGIIVVKHTYRQDLVAAHQLEQYREGVKTVRGTFLGVHEFRAPSDKECEPIGKSVDMTERIR